MPHSAALRDTIDCACVPPSIRISAPKSYTQLMTVAAVGEVAVVRDEQRAVRLGGDPERVAELPPWVTSVCAPVAGFTLITLGVPSVPTFSTT